MGRVLRFLPKLTKRTQGLSLQPKTILKGAACCRSVVHLCSCTVSSSLWMTGDLMGPLGWWVSEAASDFYLPIW